MLSLIVTPCKTYAQGKMPIYMYVCMYTCIRPALSCGWPHGEGLCGFWGWGGWNDLKDLKFYTQGGTIQSQHNT